MTRSAQPARPVAADGTADGRVRRGQDNRARIVAAMVELVRSGMVSPSAQQVADRADVGLRTVFRHFQDMESLYREMARVVGLEAAAFLQAPFRAEHWRDRIVEMVGRRARGYELIAPFKRASDAFRHQSEVLGADYARGVQLLRGILERELPPEVLADADKVEALDMLLSFEAWSRLRREQGLSQARAEAVLERAVRAVLA